MLLSKYSALGFLALMPALLVEAAKSTTKTSTKTVFLPSRSTGSASHIYASVITSDASKTEYLLACQTAFKSPYSCDGDFTGVTVTYSASSDVDVAFGAATYNCTVGKSSAVCATKTASSADERTTTLGSSASKAWMTPITVLEVKKKTTSKAGSSKTASSDSSVCKRATHHGSSSGGGSDKSSDSSSSKSSKSSKKGGSDSCSDASANTWQTGVFGVVAVGVAFAAFGL